MALCGVTLSDDLHRLETNLVRSNGFRALTGQYLVDMLPRMGLLSVQQHFVATGELVLPLTGAADLESGDIVGVAHAPLLRVSLDALQHATHVAEPHPGQIADRQVSAVTGLLEPGETASAVTSPSSALVERLDQDQRSSFLRVWARLPPHLREITFALHLSLIHI